ncbi:MAG: CoA-transferase [Candidatus Promineifilaceae bacterium]
MIDKTLSLDEAVRFILDGHTIALGGMTIYRRPVAFVQALISTEIPPRKLTLFSFTAGLAADMLVGAGLVERIRTCYFGLESFGLAPMFTNAAGNGAIEIIEESEASIANGLRAKMAGVSFMPSRAWQGTDMFSVRQDVRIIKDPYNGDDLTAFPAIGCDVAVIHVLKADRFGNCRLGGNPTIDHELTLVADKVIITAEEVVESLETRVDFSGLPVSAVVHLPHGAWPTSCYPTYPIDGDEILRYIDACNKGEFEPYIRQLSR